MSDNPFDPQQPERDNVGRIRVQQIIPHKGFVDSVDDLFTNRNTSERALDDDHQELP